MSRFKRKPKPKPEPDFIIGHIPSQPLPGDPEYDYMRPDKRKVPAPTAEEYKTAAFNITLAMIRSFGYKPWMAMVYGPDGERINTEGEVI